MNKLLSIVAVAAALVLVASGMAAAVATADPVVPEPGSIVALIAGLAGLGFLRRRK